jgi:hypothetical protein
MVRTEAKSSLTLIFSAMPAPHSIFAEHMVDLECRSQLGASRTHEGTKKSLVAAAPLGRAKALHEKAATANKTILPLIPL